MGAEFKPLLSSPFEHSPEFTAEIFGSLECAASPALCGTGSLPAAAGRPCIFHPVASLSPGQLERVPLLFSLCCALLLRGIMTRRLVSPLPGCPRRESIVSRSFAAGLPTFGQARSQRGAATLSWHHQHFVEPLCSNTGLGFPALS